MITLQRIICFTLILSLLLPSCAANAPTAPQRIVRVKALADPKLRERNPHWQEEVGELVEAASDHFEREFGIRLVAQSIGPWPLEERILSTAHLLSYLKEKFPLNEQGGSYDLLIGFTGENVDTYKGRARVDRIGNCQQGLGAYVVSSVSGPFHYRGRYSEPELDVVALIHELGHIFGAEHTQDISSIMHENFDYRTEFDKKNREIILKNKFCPFAK